MKKLTEITIIDANTRLGFSLKLLLRDVVTALQVHTTSIILWGTRNQFEYQSIIGGDTLLA